MQFQPLSVQADLQTHNDKGGIRLEEGRGCVKVKWSLKAMAVT